MFTWQLTQCTISDIWQPSVTITTPVYDSWPAIMLKNISRLGSRRKLNIYCQGQDNPNRIKKENIIVSRCIFNECIAFQKHMWRQTRLQYSCPQPNVTKCNSKITKKHVDLYIKKYLGLQNNLHVKHPIDCVFYNWDPSTRWLVI